MAGQEAAELAHSLVFRERCRFPDHRSRHARPADGTGDVSGSPAGPVSGKFAGLPE